MNEPYLWHSFILSVTTFICIEILTGIKNFGVPSGCYFSSTMDFAAAEGFADDDGAINLFDRGVFGLLSCIKNTPITHLRTKLELIYGVVNELKIIKEIKHEYQKVIKLFKKDNHHSGMVYRV